jgi:bifunctional DNA-binding transcriptional regulator/antitoxin component of YhaV-PrlF toxin-antitoxin module
MQSEEVPVPAIKKKGRIIRPAGTRTVYKFINDTILSNIFYDDQNRIILKRSRSGDYYDAYYYEYNEQGRIRKELHCRETNVSEDKKVFMLGVQHVLSLETFEYEFSSATQLRKKCLNDEGREYKKGIINFDDKGNKLSENYEFIVSWMHQENLYEYNAVNLVSRHIFISNISGEMKSERAFEYDKDGSLVTEKKMKDGVVQNEIGYLFDDVKLVKSHVDRDFKNASIGIVKYAYTFY